jgi:hypothetical protein
MRRKSAPMRIAKPALRRGSHFPTSSHLRASRFFFFLSFFFDFLSSSVCLFYIFNGSQMATNFFISPFGSFNLLSGAHLFYLFRSAFFFAFSIRTEWGEPKKEFVYLFAPLRHLLKEADLQNFRLENGLKIWPALWDYRHPNAQCFTAPVRPKKSSTIRKKTNNNAAAAAAAVVASSASSNPLAPIPTATTSASVAAASVSGGALPTVSAAPPLTPRETVTFSDVFIGKVISRFYSHHRLISLILVFCLCSMLLYVCDAFLIPPQSSSNLP